RAVERAPGHDRHLVGELRDEIFGELGQQLTGGGLVRPVGTVEEADPHAGSSRWARYHSIVCRSPAWKSVDARKPKHRSARVTSSMRRGWPSGLVASKVSAPRKPVSSAINRARSRMLISNPAPMFTGSGSL